MGSEEEDGWSSSAWVAGRPWFDGLLGGQHVTLPVDEVQAEVACLASVQHPALAAVVAIAVGGVPGPNALRVQYLPPFPQSSFQSVGGGGRRHVQACVTVSPV